MGAVSQSVAGNQRNALIQVMLAADDSGKYEGLEFAFRKAVEKVLANNANVKSAIAAEVQASIINVFNQAQAANAPWPFPRP